MANKNCDCEALYSEVINEVSGHMPDETDLDMVVSFFKVLGDNTRIRILSALRQHEMCAGDIAVLLDMTKSAVSHQLAIMRQMRQVKTRRDGKNIFYSLDDNHIVEIIDEAFIHMRDAEI